LSAAMSASGRVGRGESEYTAAAERVRKKA
jgi:hypothetical protein